MSNSTVYLQELPYSPDSSQLFERIRHLPGALLLDSCYPHSNLGRFDIITADPHESFIFNSLDTDSYSDYLNYFSSIEAAHSKAFDGVSTPAEEIPFCGGIAGHLDYGFGKPLQHLPAEMGARAELNLYSWAVVQDHVLQRCTFAALPLLAAGPRDKLLETLRQPSQSSISSFELQRKFAENFTATEYEAAFRAIQRYILAGDCYQVNLAQRFSSSFAGEPWSAYQLLRPVAAAPYSAFMQCADDSQLLCLSPERFLSLHGNYVETRPIKGTRPRHHDRETDEMLAAELRMSPKDRAENLMIVDLLRNDIGRNCSPGSIHVDRLFELEAYPTVFHLVSTISGELAPQHSAYDLLRDCFPGGSITGAPKRRAMEIINELEPDGRQAYCGSMLYIAPDGRMDSNIAIRTLLCRDQEIHCWAGGGIVADSGWEKEYQETYDKVGKFLQTLENTITL
jgi:para-aminobenzoate synthetase component I